MFCSYPDLAVARSHLEIAPMLKREAHALGYEFHSAVFFRRSGDPRAPWVNPKDQVDLIDLPPGYVNDAAVGYSNPRAASRDPLLTHVLVSPTPFIWDERDYSAPESIDLFAAQAAYGLRYGIALGVHDLSGSSLLFGVDTARPPSTNPVVLREVISKATALATTLFAVLEDLRMAYPRESSPTRPNLTRAQVECLKWAAAGKTAWETGYILSIAESTVAKHLGAACRALGCANKRNAVAIAIRHGWI